VSRVYNAIFGFIYKFIVALVNVVRSHNSAYQNCWILYKYLREACKYQVQNDNTKSICVSVSLRFSHQQPRAHFKLSNILSLSLSKTD
jgi:hypothetical protein